MGAGTVLSYDDVQGRLPLGRSHLLLGNGFSIACDPRFSYGRLFDFAKEHGLTDRVIGVFERLGTNNFEGVMRLLEDSDWIARHYALLADPTDPASAMKEDLIGVKNALVQALAETHIAKASEVADEKKAACAKFLEPFHNVFTTNYDLLVYWVEMAALDILKGRDGFNSDVEEPDAPYVVFSEHVGNDKGVFFVHGALHLYVVDGQVRKHTWSRTQIPLVQNIREALAEHQYPLFVAEGFAEKKLEQIQRSGYLSYCLGKLQRIKSALVVLGLSFGESDRHIANVIADNKELETVFVGLHGEPNSAANTAVKANVELMRKRRDTLVAARRARNPLSVQFYSSQTAPVWG